MENSKLEEKHSSFKKAIENDDIETCINMIFTSGNGNVEYQNNGIETDSNITKCPTIFTDNDLQQVLLNLCIKKRLWHYSMRIFVQIEKPPLQIVNSILKMATRDFHPLEAENFLTDISNNCGINFQPSAPNYATIVTGYGMVGDWKSAKRIFEIAEKKLQSKSKDIVLYSAYLSALVKGQAPIVIIEEIFQRIDTECTKRTIFRKKKWRVVTDNSVNLCSDKITATSSETCESQCNTSEATNKNEQSGNKDWKSVQTRKVQDQLTLKDTICYSAMLKMCERNSLWKRMQELLEEMTVLQVPKDVIVYNTAIGVCCNVMSNCIKNKTASESETTTKYAYVNDNYLSDKNASSNNLITKQTVIEFVQYLLRDMDARKISKTAVTLTTSLRVFEIAEEFQAGLMMLVNHFTTNLHQPDEQDSESETEPRKSAFASNRPNYVTQNMLDQATERLEMKIMNSGFYNMHRKKTTESDKRDQVKMQDTLDNKIVAQHHLSDIGSEDPMFNRQSDTTSHKTNAIDQELSKKLNEVISQELLPSIQEYDVARVIEEKFDNAFSQISIENEFQYGPLKIASYGSIKCGLALKGSDIDLTILTGSFQDNINDTKFQNDHDEARQTTFDRHMQQQVLLNLLKLEKLIPSFKVVEMRLGGRIPVAKCTIDAKQILDQSGKDQSQPIIEIDVTVDNYHGIKKTKFLEHEIGRNEMLRNLTLIVKKWAKKQNIIGQSSGFLGGYSYSLLVANFARAVYTSKAALERDLLGKALFRFFEYYTNDNVWRNDTRSSIDADFMSSNQRLILWDPIEPAWNLGSILSQSRLEKTRKCFADAHDVISKVYITDSVVLDSKPDMYNIEKILDLFLDSEKNSELNNGNVKQ